MSPLLLSGRATREALVPDLIRRVKALSFVPIVAIIQVGDRPDSTAFIKVKKAFAEKIGVTVKEIHLKESVSESEVIEAIKECNADRNIRGIVVQLPLPISIDRDRVIEAIDPKKDIDALTPLNAKHWLEAREDAIFPATARGVRELLEYYKISLAGKHVVVVGRSMLVGKPIAVIAENENATVTVCHSKTADLMSETRQADVLIVAAGRLKLITIDHVKEGAVVVDVGINTVKGKKLEDEIAGRKLVGDVDFEAVRDITSAITPVPGGVGPMTVLALFENLVDLCLSPKR